MMINLYTYLKNKFSKFNEFQYKKKIILQQYGLFYFIKNNSGYMLVIVLIISTLLISLSSEFLLTARVNTRYMIKFKNETQAEQIASAGINLATAILTLDRRGGGANLIKGVNSDKNIDTLNDIWAVNFPEIPFGIGSLKIEINDEQSKINLSALANEFVDKTPYYGILQHFLLNMNYNIDIADTIIDWIDIDDSRFPNGAETYDYYSTLPSPYKTKDTAMDSIDELLLIKHITPEIFYGLGKVNSIEEESLVDSNKQVFNFSLESIESGLEKQNIDEIKIGKEKSRRFDTYFRVNGDQEDYTKEINKININTATFRVISALTDNMTDDIVTDIIKKRISQPFKSVDELSDYIKDETARKNIITVKSELFSIKSTGYVNNQQITIYAIYNRQRKQFLYYSIQ